MTAESSTETSPETSSVASPSTDKSNRWISAVDAATKVAAPIAIVSALLYYFASIKTEAVFEHFGVPPGLIEYSKSDYLLRSDVLFRPLICGGTLALLVITAIIGVGALESKYHFYKKRKWTQDVLGGLAILAGYVAAAGLFSMRGVVPPAAAGSLIAFGVILLAFRQLRAASGQKTSTIWFVFAIAIVIIGAFWATALYAQSAGESAGAELAAGKTSNPAATVYSTTQLPMLGGRQLPLAPSTNTTPASPAPEKQWRYVYSGYRVLAFTGNRWILVPATDTQKVVNNAVVLAANDSILVELEERTPREPSSAMANGIPGLTQLNEDMVTLTPRVNISFKPAGGIAEVGPNRFQYGMPAPAQSSGQDLPKLAVEWTVIPTNSAPPSECAIVARISTPDGKMTEDRSSSDCSKNTLKPIEVHAPGLYTVTVDVESSRSSESVFNATAFLVSQQ